jgi:hypothetical protein
MFGPGEYRPDPSAGITAPADLPQPEIVLYKQSPQSTRRNGLPVECINRSLVMRHEHPACALV